MPATEARNDHQIVENEDSPEIERWRALAEIDEKLIRRDLAPAQRAKLVSNRKAA